MHLDPTSLITLDIWRLSKALTEVCYITSRHSYDSCCFNSEKLSFRSLKLYAASWLQGLNSSLTSRILYTNNCQFDGLGFEAGLKKSLLSFCAVESETMYEAKLIVYLKSCAVFSFRLSLSFFNVHWQFCDKWRHLIILIRSANLIAKVLSRSFEEFLDLSLQTLGHCLVLRPT